MVNLVLESELKSCLAREHRHIVINFVSFDLIPSDLIISVLVNC